MAQAESNPTLPWKISSEDFPHDGTNFEKWAFLLGYAILAPSNHNSQPWLFRIDGRTLELYADRTRSSHATDPEDRELIISCGCALLHLRSSLAHFGYLGGIDILPDKEDPDLIARLSLGVREEASTEESILFYEITRRRTNRQPFLSDPVPPSVLHSLHQAAREEFAWFEVVSDVDRRRQLGELIAEADRRQWANKRFRLELAAWVSGDRGRQRDGIPGYSRGVEDLLSEAGPSTMRTFDLGDGQAAMDQELVAGSPVLAALGADGDGPRDWVHSGMALARVLLRARANDVWASFLNQPIEVPYLRQQMSSIIGRAGFPQICLRLGLGTEIRPTPRRGVADVLV